MRLVKERETEKTINPKVNIVLVVTCSCVNTTICYNRLVSFCSDAEEDPNSDERKLVRVRNKVLI